MSEFDDVLNAASRLSDYEQLRLAFELAKEYDGCPREAIAEAWAVAELKMEKFEAGTAGVDGKLPSGRLLQVKSKKASAHQDNRTYVTLSTATLSHENADLLIVFIDYDKGVPTRIIGPVAIDTLKERSSGRYFIGDIVARQDVQDRSL